MAANEKSPAPHRIERQADGRHAVMDANGQVMGLHNSTWSAARQMHDYFGGSAPGGNASATPTKAAKAGPVPRPHVPHPAPNRPKIPRPKVK